MCYIHEYSIRTAIDMDLVQQAKYTEHQQRRHGGLQIPNSFNGTFIFLPVVQGIVLYLVLVQHNLKACISWLTMVIIFNSIASTSYRRPATYSLQITHVLCVSDTRNNCSRGKQLRGSLTSPRARCKQDLKTNFLLPCGV
jgi:hypothetical protein